MPLRKSERAYEHNEQTEEQIEDEMNKGDLNLRVVRDACACGSPSHPVDAAVENEYRDEVDGSDDYEGSKVHLNGRGGGC